MGRFTATVVAACLLASPMHLAAAKAIDNFTEETPTPRLRSAADDGCIEAPSSSSQATKRLYHDAAVDAVIEQPPPFATHHNSSAISSTFSLPSDIASSDLLPISEITSVVINDVDPSNRLVRALTKRPDRLYVSFAHRGAHRGTSLPLNDLLESSFVNLPILDTDEARLEPVRCTILRRRRFLPDKTLYTGDVIFRHNHVWHDANNNGVVDEGEESTRRELTGTSVIRDMKGRDTGAKIELRLFSTEYVAATVEGHRTNKPSRVDWYYTALIKFLPMLMDKFFIGDGTSSFSKPVDEANPQLKLVSTLNGNLTYPKRDEFVDPIWEVDYIVPFMNWILPFTSRNNLVDDRVSLRNNIRVNKLGNNVIEPWEGRWLQPLSDRSMTRYFFYHQGHFKTRTVDKEKDRYLSINGVQNAYVADMTFFSPLKYRDNFENLGCKVYFDSDAHITLIENTNGSAIFPGTPGWEWAKQKARSALFTEVAFIHIVHYHMTWGNIPAQALRMFLPPTHPIRVSLTMHFFRTHQTCLQVKDFLVAERGPLGRALPFEYEGGYKDALMSMVNSFEFKFWPDEVAERGVNFTIGATDGVDLHLVMTNYASALVDEAYPHPSIFEGDADLRKSYEFLVEKLPGAPSEYTMDNVKRVWGEILTRVTGMHTSIGNAIITATEPFFINFRQTTNDDFRVVAGSREVISTVSTITGLTVPDLYPSLATNWTNLLHDADSAAYSQLKRDLAKLGEEIDERNKERDFVNVDFHPKTAAISIFS